MKLVAWMTHNEQTMLFLDREEAESYCADDEEPESLYALPDGYVIVRRDVAKDSERLRKLAWPEAAFDGMNGIDLHQEASIYASALGRAEPNGDDYLAAIRTAIDASEAK